MRLRYYIDMGDNSSTCGTALLLSSINRYYSNNPKYMGELIDIIEGKSDVSLRVLDWLVTHYAKTRSVVYWIDDKTGKVYEKIDIQLAKKCRKFRLYEDYRVQLKSFTKLYFDPFRRHNRITYGERDVETTIGQLNFFKWIFKNGILEYARMNLSKIYDDMSISCKKKGKKVVKDMNKITKEISFLSFK